MRQFSVVGQGILVVRVSVVVVSRRCRPFVVGEASRNLAAGPYLVGVYVAVVGHCETVAFGGAVRVQAVGVVTGECVKPPVAHVAPVVCHGVVA